MTLDERPRKGKGARFEISIPKDHYRTKEEVTKVDQRSAVAS